MLGRVREGIHMRTRLSLGQFAAMWVAGGVGIVFFLAVVTGLTLDNHGWFGYLQLVRYGAVAEGVVVRTEPRSHCLTEYRFSVAGRNYSGGGSECGAAVGQSVTVTYLVADPAQSSLELARERLINELAAFVAGAILLPPFLILLLRRRRGDEHGSLPTN